jgi:hypothetical protein
MSKQNLSETISNVNKYMKNLKVYRSLPSNKKFSLIATHNPFRIAI